MSTIIRASDSNRTTQSVAFNFDDMTAQADRYLAKIRAEAAKIVVKAQEDAEAIRKRVKMVRGGRPTVLALGGGAFVREENYELLADHGVTVWLDCPLEIAWRRVEPCANRPLARDCAKFIELFQARRPAYARAEYRVEVTGDDTEAVVDAICALPMF